MKTGLLIETTNTFDNIRTSFCAKRVDVESWIDDNRYFCEVPILNGIELQREEINSTHLPLFLYVEDREEEGCPEFGLHGWIEYGSTTIILPAVNQEGIPYQESLYMVTKSGSFEEIQFFANKEELHAAFGDHFGIYLSTSTEAITPDGRYDIRLVTIE